MSSRGGHRAAPTTHLRVPPSVLSGDAADQLERLFEVMPDATIAVEEGRIVMLNRLALDLFGYARAELIGEPIERLVPHRLRAQHVGHRARYARDPYSRPMGDANVSLFGLRKDGTEFPAEISLSTLVAGSRTLVVTAVRNITERLVAESIATEESHRRAIAEAMLHAEQAERARIATALHDDTIQVMTASLIALDRLAAAATDERTSSAAQAARATIHDAAERTRRLMFELRPAVLYERGLAGAIPPIAEEAAREIGADADVEITGQRFPNAVEELVYRTLQEAITNARKHSKASRISVRVGVEDDVMVSSVSDDGRGFDLQAAREAREGFLHIGLETMAERVRMAGGDIRIHSAAGQGTEVSFEIPLGTAQTV